MANVGIPEGGISGSSKPGNGSVYAGLALIGAGAILVSMGISSVSSLAALQAGAGHPTSSAAITPCPPPRVVTSTASGGAAHGHPTAANASAQAAPSADGPSASASAAPAASAAPSASASAVAAPAAQGDAPLLVIRFVKKEVFPQKEDIAKLAAIGNKLARRDGVKVVLEGFGDDVGADEATKGLGRRRGTVLKRTLADVGVLAERVTVTPIDLAEMPGGEGAGTVRLRTIPPLTEGEVLSP